jgi:hypothetical protein
MFLALWEELRKLTLASRLPSALFFPGAYNSVKTALYINTRSFMKFYFLVLSITRLLANMLMFIVKTDIHNSKIIFYK